MAHLLMRLQSSVFLESIILLSCLFLSRPYADRSPDYGADSVLRFRAKFGLILHILTGQPGASGQRKWPPDGRSGQK